MTEMMEIGFQEHLNLSEIVVVSEDQAFPWLIFDDIQRMGTTVNCVKDSRLLTQELLSKQPDLILLDFSLSSTDGIAVCRLLKNSGVSRSIPVVLMLTVNDLEQRAQGFQAGAVDYLLKPLILEDVFAKLNLHVRQRRLSAKFTPPSAYADKCGQTGQDVEPSYQEISCEECIELPLQKRYFRDIFHNLPDSICLVEVTSDRRFRYLETNQAFELNAGAAQDSLRGAYIGDLSLSLEDELIIAKFRQCLETGSLVDEELSLNLQQNQRICRVMLTPLFNDMGGIDRILGVFRDITERKQAEQQARFMKYALDQAHDAVFLADPQAGYRFSYVNDKACQSLGYSRDELLNMTVPDIDPFVDFVAAGKCHDQIRKQVFIFLETLHRRKDGQVFPVEVSGTEVEFDGQTMWLSIVRDITERKRLEEQLRLKEFAIDYARDAIYLIDRHQRFVYVNDAACRSLGFSRDELLGLTPFDIDPDVTQADARRFRQQMLVDGSFSLETRHRRRDGSVFPVEVRGSLFEYQGQRMSMTLARDITERKHMELQVQNHLYFFESMDKINRVIQGSIDMETVLNDVLDTLLTIFDCDRAYLSYPCDPDADSWSVPFERNHSKFPGVHALGLSIAMDEGKAAALRILLDTADPVTYGPENQFPLPKQVSEQFGFKSYMAMAIYPKGDKPWAFGMQQCSRTRGWTADEQKIFKEIGRRLADSLSSLLAYRTLQSSEREYRTLAENAPFGIARYDVQGRITYFNLGVEKAINKTLAEIKGLRPTECLPKTLYADYEKYLLQVAESGEGLEFDLVFPIDDGLEICRINMLAERDAEGTVNGVLAIGRDISQQRRAEESLQKSEALYRSMVSAMVEGVVVMGQDGEIVSMNPAAAKILGLPLEPGHTIRPLNTIKQVLSFDAHPFPMERFPATLCLQTGMPQIEVEMGFARADGETVWVLVNSQPLFLEDKVKPYAVVSTFHDITERKRVESTLKFMAQSGWQESREAFLVSLASFLGQILEIDYVLIDKLTTPDEAETLVVWHKGELLSNMRYSLAGTPCDQVMEGRLCCYPDGVQQRFPEDELLVDMQVESYAGIPLRDSAGNAIGLIAVMDGKPMQDQNKVVSILQLVAIRVAAELERDRFERALAESRQFLRRVIDALAEPVFVKDRLHRWIMLNEAFSKIIGHPLEVLLGKSDYDFFPSDEADEFWRVDEEVFLSGEEHVNEEDFTDRNGVTHSIITKKTRYIDDHGEAVLVGIILDITERKQMEKSLIAHEQELRVLAETSPGIMASFHMKPDGSFCMPYTSPNIQEICGFNPQQLAEDAGPLLAINHPDDAQRVYESILESARTMTVWQTEYRIMHPTRGVRWMEGRSKPTRHPEGGVIWYGYVHDVTERKQMEAIIRQREEEFRTLAENLPDVIVRYDKFLRRTYVNKVYRIMLEPLGADLLGKTPQQYWKVSQPNAGEFTQMLQYVIKTGRPETTLIQAETRGGRMIHWTMNLVPEFDQDGEVVGVLSCATDITELKEYQQEMELSRMQLRALASRNESLREEERKRIARELHDDLGQRLTALKLDLARLMLRFGENNPPLQQQVREMEVDMGATIQIVREVATQLRPSALEMGIVSALEWLVLEFRKRTAVECQLRISKRKIELNDSQATALFRIVQESLTNIMRYAKASAVKIVLSCSAQQYVLEISDDGVGFDVHQKRKTGSFGLIGIEERALSLGGNMNIESAPGKGMKLTINIPVAHEIGEK